MVTAVRAWGAQQRRAGRSECRAGGERAAPPGAVLQIGCPAQTGQRGCWPRALMTPIMRSMA